DVIDDNTCIHYCIYHSRYPLAIRSHLESKLDKVLKRKNPNEIWQNDDIKRMLKQHKQSNHIFVVIASPVAEVGRDHDYDWAIIEPSSIRSIIQIAGRVLRHRDEKKPTAENILLNQNYKAIKQNNNNNRCFEKPGFESDELRMENYDLNQILETNQYQNINAIQRITMLENITPNTNGKYDNLVDLEHSALKEKLFANKGSAKMWWKNHPHWCGEMQRQQRFRESKKDDGYYLFLDNEDSEVYWQQLNEDVYPSEFGELCTISINKENLIVLGNNNHFWFDLSANEIYTTLKNDPKIAVDNFEQISKRFGEVRIVEYEVKAITQYTYHKNLGLYRNLGEENGR
ncbi:MAG: type I-F CRISPR-associated helicase Cas3, partial [Proteobacteria bacterium]|nr:type I-F CRISPR-associated helicase Cas3 [Pseudomonadota bacterium]